MPDPLPPPADLEALRRRLRQSVSRVCPSWLSAQLDDIVQVAVLRVVEALRQGGGNRELPASYLKKVAYSAAVDEIRRHDRRREVPLEDSPEMELAPSGAGDPEQAHASRQAGEAIRDCLSRLVLARRRAVTLYLIGHTVPEAGRMMRWSLRKAEHLVYRGLDDLRRCLDSKGLRP